MITTNTNTNNDDIIQITTITKFMGFDAVTLREFIAKRDVDIARGNAEGWDHVLDPMHATYVNLLSDRALALESMRAMEATDEAEDEDDMHASWLKEHQAELFLSADSTVLFQQLMEDEYAIRCRVVLIAPRETETEDEKHMVAIYWNLPPFDIIIPKKYKVRGREYEYPINLGECGNLVGKLAKKFGEIYRIAEAPKSQKLTKLLRSWQKEASILAITCTDLPKL